MPPSQLKQLKASLHANGILGPQKSKSKRKAESKDATKSQRRNAALTEIRERFNPFEARTPAHRDKYEVVYSKPSKASVVRPGVTRGFGEERRRETLLKEIQSRNKAGGLLDRRFGEDDPFMTPEQKAAERFARQNERRMKRNDMFNLEDDSAEESTLTHGGRALVFGGSLRDDYQENQTNSIGELEFPDDRPSKRARINDDEDPEGQSEHSGLLVKKTKNEVMKEIIAKSKAYKADRQAVKEDDNDLRMDLDKDMSEFYEAFQNQKPLGNTLLTPPSTDSEPQMNPARAAMLAGKSREEVENEYEASLRQLKLEARSKPSVRTKTDDEKAAEEASRLQDLEKQRLLRMNGDIENSDQEDAEQQSENDIDIDQDDAELFGLSQPKISSKYVIKDVEEEDEFDLDEDLIANGSDDDLEIEYDSDEALRIGGTRIVDEDEGEDGEDDFINGLVLPPSAEPSGWQRSIQSGTQSSTLAYTFTCPTTHEDFLSAINGVDVNDLPTVVQRIRALHHKGLAEENKEKLERFAGVLVQHITHLANTNPRVPYPVLEALLRHIHSMAKDQPLVLAIAFRSHLMDIVESRSLKLNLGDLVLLTGISSIFPTSDHFHVVVTPAMLTIGRYLGQGDVQTLQDLGIRAYCCSLALQYQRLSRRYVPEVINSICTALSILSPTALSQDHSHKKHLDLSLGITKKSLRINKIEKSAPEKLSLSEIFLMENTDSNAFATALLHNYLKLTNHAARLWQSKSAFPEILFPLINAVTHIAKQTPLLSKETLKLAESTRKTLFTLLEDALRFRKPLLLHNHRPIAIKTSVPAFIDNYNPERHYDPNRERAEMSKLRAEHKRERKGAMREIRKDANFIARERLKEKKEKDAAYEKKFKRLVAEIQSEEGREAKEYNREKMKRTGKW